MIETFKEQIPMFKWSDNYFVKGENTAVLFLESDVNGEKEYHVLIKGKNKEAVNICSSRVKTLISEMDNVELLSTPVEVDDNTISFQVSEIS